jgi:hypothetical protein
MVIRILLSNAIAMPSLYPANSGGGLCQDDALSQNETLHSRSMRQHAPHDEHSRCRDVADDCKHMHDDQAA